MSIETLEEGIRLQLPDSTPEPSFGKLKNSSETQSGSLLDSKESESSLRHLSNLAEAVSSLPTSDLEIQHMSKTDLEFLDRTLAIISQQLQDTIRSINGLRLDLRQLPDGKHLLRIPGSQQL